jgi:hypothetical protein
VVGQSQPYRKGTDFATHALRVLRDLINRDKHRDLVIASYAMSAFTVGERDLDTVVSTKVHDVPMQVGAVVAEANLELAQDIRGERWEQVACEVEYGEYIEIPDARPVNLMSVMQGIVNPLGALLDELDAEPGRRPRRRASAVVRVATTSCVRAVLGCMLCRRSTRTVPTAMARISRCRRCV